MLRYESFIYTMYNVYKIHQTSYIDARVKVFVTANGFLP